MLKPRWSCKPHNRLERIMVSDLFVVAGRAAKAQRSVLFLESDLRVYAQPLHVPHTDAFHHTPGRSNNRTEVVNRFTVLTFERRHTMDQGQEPSRHWKRERSKRISRITTSAI